MQIIDNCGLVERMVQLVCDDGEKEHCAIACACADGSSDYALTIFDYCMVEELGGKTSRASATIPARISCALLNLCKQYDYVPVIVHTHRLNGDGHVSFSPQDLRFIESFACYAAEMGGIPASLFLVTNGKMLMCCFYDKRYANLLFGEAQCNAEDRSRGLYNFV